LVENAVPKATDFPVGESPRALVSGDFNQDGAPDLAVINEASRDLSLLLNDGAGGISEIRSASLRGAPTALVAGDIDQDGLLDLVVGTDAPGLELFTRGDALQAALPVALPTTPRSLALGNYNNDNLPDLILARDESLQMIIGGEGFQGGLGGLDFNGPAPQATVALDIDQDGLDDAAVVDRQSGELFLLDGQGNGAMNAVGPLFLCDTPLALAAGDLNQDTTTDFVIACQSQGAAPAGIFLSFTEAGNGPIPPTFFATDAAFGSLALADFTRDGIPDIAFSDAKSARFGFLEGQAGGVFLPPFFFALPGTSSALVAVDFDQNGTFDIAATSPENDAVFFSPNLLPL
jgi:hypothetical protein